MHAQSLMCPCRLVPTLEMKAMTAHHLPAQWQIIDTITRDVMISLGLDPVDVPVLRRQQVKV